MRRGFTLIELLVVVSLIVLLIAMLMPVLGSARDTMRTVNCASNLHQMGNALTNYTLDWDYYPVGIDQHADNAQRVWLWPPQLRTYNGGSSDLFHCPATDESTRWVKAFGSGEPAWYGYDNDEVRVRGFSHVFSYGYNVWGAWIGANPNLGLGVYRKDPIYGEVRRSRVQVPSDMISFADSTLTDYWSGYIGIYRVGQYPSQIHRGKANILYVDNHVVAKEQLEVINTGDPLTVRQWNNDHLPH